MTRRHAKSTSYTRILTVVVFLMFGLMIIGLLFKAFSADTDIRSQAAARTDVTVGIWDFNGDTLDNWTAERFDSARIGNGVLTLKLPKSGTKTPFLNSKDVHLSVPAGNKTFRVRMAVDSKPTTSSLPNDSHFAINVYYRLEGKSNWERPLTLDGKADGEFREYAVKFPFIAGILISEVQLNMSNIPAAGSVTLDWVKLTYQRTSAWTTNLPRPSITNAPRPPDGRVCIQVITWARNSTTRECKQFPTPCALPDGWIADKTCTTSRDEAF